MDRDMDRYCRKQNQAILRLLSVAVLVLPLLLSAAAVCGKTELPGRTDTWVNDYAGIIDPDTRAYLEGLISSIEQRTPEPVEVIIATFPELDGWDFSEFARQYGEKWREAKLGKRDNGVIILVAVKEKRVSLGIGQNLKEILNDAVINDILNRLIMPEFQKGDFSAGVKKAAVRVVEILNTASIPTGSPLAGRIAAIIAVIVIALAIRKFLIAKRKG